MLEIRDLSVQRGKRRTLTSVSLRAEAGQIWGLIGPNGSGKSTLLETLIGAMAAASGQIEIASTAVDQLTRRERARLMTLVGRELPSDLPLTGRQLIELGRLPHQTPFASWTPNDERAVELAICDAGCEELADRLVSELSAGEAERVYFARALAQEPRILLLDEATAHLDLVHRERALLRVRSFAQKGGLAVVALHDLDLALRYCTHLAVLDRGRLIARGAPHSVLSRSLLADVFGVDAAPRADGSGLHIIGPSATFHDTRTDQTCH